MLQSWLAHSPARNARGWVVLRLLRKVFLRSGPWIGGEGANRTLATVRARKGGRWLACIFFLQISIPLPTTFDKAYRQVRLTTLQVAVLPLLRLSLPGVKLSRICCRGLVPLFRRRRESRFRHLRLLSRFVWSRVLLKYTGSCRYKRSRATISLMETGARAQSWRVAKF